MEFYKVAQEIKKLRKEQQFTQAQLAEKVGISRQTLSKLEQGKIDKISLQVFLKLVDMLNYELEIVEKKPFYYFNVDDL